MAGESAAIRVGIRKFRGVNYHPYNLTQIGLGCGGIRLSATMKENEMRLNKAISILQIVSEDTTAPRNIRKAIKEAITSLQDSKMSLAVRAANAVSILEEVVQDPNLPSFSRVNIWAAVSQLEAIKE